MAITMYTYLLFIGPLISLYNSALDFPANFTAPSTPFFPILAFPFSLFFYRSYIMCGSVAVQLILSMSYRVVISKQKEKKANWNWN